MPKSQMNVISRTRIKICGITNHEDAVAAIDAGADALGFVFYPPSPRYVTAAQARSILSDLPPFVSRVGLFLDAAPADVEAALRSLPLDLLQFHGNESPDYCGNFAKPYMKAIGTADTAVIPDLVRQYHSAEALLFDSHSNGAAGGTGQTFDWSVLPNSIKNTIVLAGGLTPQNVASAIKTVHPYAVDVSSGVESSAGKKDVSLMKDFVAQVRRADSE